MNEVTPAAAGDPSELMKQLVKEIVHALVDQPEQVSIELIKDHESTVIRLRVAHQDRAEAFLLKHYTNGVTQAFIVVNHEDCLHCGSI